jgi:hypothetical protein
MYIVPIAWLYVALMMSVAEATHSNGSLLGALFTFLLYGALPVSIVVYIMGTPARKRALRMREASELAQQNASIQPNESSLTATDTVSAVREEP